MVGDKPLRHRLASMLNDLIAPVAPGLALRRETALAQRAVLRQRMAHYDGAGKSKRASDFRKNRTDAVEAIRADREPIAFMARDMLRNNPRAARIRRQLVNQVVGAGIRGTVRSDVLPEEDLKLVRHLVRQHCESTDFDTEGKLTLYGMQGLSFGTIVSDGEVLLRRRMRRMSDGFALPFQVQVLEADYLDRLIDGELPNGNYAVQGIEFNAIGQRVFYHLFPEHPGGFRKLALQSRRVAAENVIHAYRVDRPGQVRGVSWFAPIVTKLHELDKYQDGQIKRQEIAALFAGILQSGDNAEELEAQIGNLEAGSILTITADEKMEFTDPPAVEGYEPFMRVTERVIAAGAGLTYESVSGDYSQVNYTSGRMGRMDVDPNMREWQENLMIAQVCKGLGRWIAEAVEDMTDIRGDRWSMGWTAPVRPVIDPTKDHKADETAMRAGKKSRRQVIRENGQDPEEVEAEILAERRWEADNGVTLTSNAGAVANPNATPTETDAGGANAED